MLTLIALNVAVVILETVKVIADNYFFYLHSFDVISVIVFTIEYGLRFWSCTVNERYRRPVAGRIRFALTPSPSSTFSPSIPFISP